MSSAKKSGSKSALQLATTNNDGVPSKAQKRFNNLVKKLAQQKDLLSEWQDSSQAIHEYCRLEYDPLFNEYRAYELKRLQLLDAACADPFFRKAEKKKLSYLICEIALSLITGEGDEEIKALYNIHSGMDFDEMQRLQDADAAEVFKLMMEDMIGSPVDDVDLSSPEKIHAFMEQQLQAQEAEREALRAKRKNSKRQLAMEAQKEAEKGRIKQSIQEIYRKLVTKIHPDRESDPLERERKTQLMQKVNQAYEKKDLLNLLELQLQAELIDQAHLNRIAEDRLDAYNHLLKEQLEELQKEIDGFEMGWRMQLKVSYHEAVNPKSLMTSLKRDIRELRYQILTIKGQIDWLGDHQSLRVWLKSYRIPKKPQGLYMEGLF